MRFMRAEGRQSVSAASTTSSRLTTNTRDTTSSTVKPRTVAR